ncbi:hypothetical protein H6F63_15180 [Trichocoleus sp. FACHB-40]|nr:hypothetical protein [Trichocoleus sp. FACHB-40]
MPLLLITNARTVVVSILPSDRFRSDYGGMCPWLLSIKVTQSVLISRKRSHSLYSAKRE